MDWMHGYYASSGYSYGYYTETMPIRLRWASMLHGHIIPEANFRYLDAGFGQGVNLVMAAAMHPESEFVGIDFMPEHVAHARRLAESCGITNVTLIEGDFVELAKNPASLGEFDMTVCHGIATWISPEVKQALFSMIAQTLRPGGVFYNSYNTHPGWLGTVPFQHLVSLEQRSRSGIDAINAARAGIEALSKASDRLFTGLPSLPTRLKTLDTQASAYLVQEYGNHHWQPVFVSEMFDDMGAVKLEFLGTATLADCFDRLMDAGVRELLQQQTSVVMREQIRDYALLQSFRRDLYVKGKPPVWDQELASTLRALKVISNPLVARPAEGEPFKVKSSASELLGNGEYYGALLDKIQARPDGVTIGELIEAEPDAARQGTIVETVTLMVHAGWVLPLVAKPNPRGPEIAAKLAEIGCMGAPYRDFPLVTTANCMRLGDTDMILLKLVGDGTPHEELGERMMTLLAKLRRQLAKDGKPVTEDADRDALKESLVEEFLTKKAPFFKQVGML